MAKRHKLSGRYNYRAGFDKGFQLVPYLYRKDCKEQICTILGVHNHTSFDNYRKGFTPLKPEHIFAIEDLLKSYRVCKKDIWQKKEDNGKAE